MNSIWTSAEDKILIEFVRNHEELYNTKNKDYRKTQLKLKLWNEVGELLDRTDIDCSKRWTYVRDYYIRRKRKAGASGEAALKRSVLLTFLDGRPQRNSISNTDEEENLEGQDNSEEAPSPNQETDNDDDNDDEYNENKQGNSNDGKNDKSKGDSNNDEDIFKDVEGEIEINIVNDKKRNISEAEDHLNLPKQICQGKQTNQNELDENDLFFSSMAKIVKRLPRFEQAQLRMQIGSLVGNAELNFISNYSSETSGLSLRQHTSDTDYSEIVIPSPSKREF